MCRRSSSLDARPTHNSLAPEPHLLSNFAYFCWHFCWHAKPSLLHFRQRVCGSGTDAKLLSRRLLTNTCTDRSPSFGQCGGLTCSDGSGSHCSDAAYKCCPSDNTCQRQNQWYWQCLPESPSSGTNSAAPTETPFVPNSELLFTAGHDPAVPGCKFCLEA